MRTPRAGRADSAPRPPPRCAPGRSSRDRARRRAASACTGGCGAANSRFVGASSTMRPRYITPTRSAMWWITARLCEMKRYVRPSRCCSSRIRFSTCACTETSSAEVGSSHTRKRGCVESARAIEIRCRWPPENWCGYFAPSARARPTCASSAATREATSARGRLRRLREDRLGDDVGDAPARIEARVGILEDHLHAAPRRALRGAGRSRRRPPRRRRRIRSRRASACTARR